MATQSIFDNLADQTKQKRFSFSVQGLPSDKFLVTDLQGSEAISRLYSFQVNLVSEDARIGFDSVIDKTASLAIRRNKGSNDEYVYHGIVTEFEQERKVGRYTFYRVTIEPRLSILSRYRYSEVYINQSVSEIIAGVLRDCGLVEEVDFVRRLKTYPQCDFVCQYEESCFDFISRLMEREGIYYYFEPGQERERMVIVDSLIGNTSGSADLTYRQASEMETEPGIDSMQSFVCSERVLPRSVKIRNYYYDNAQPQIYGEATVSTKGIGVVEIYGEDVRTTADATNLAKIRAEELLCRQKTHQGESSAVGVRPGLFFNLARHYRDDFCQKYLPTAIVHEGAQSVAGLTGLGSGLQGQGRKPFYQNKLTAIPANVQFRPERTTQRPVVNGTISGFIDGPSGTREYADLDDKGRYKIWFPFRRKEPQEGELQHQSGYVRFASPNAGPESGLHLPLRKDTEVVLAFSNGNPDLPMITAAVANSKFPNIVTSKNHTRNVLKTRGKNLLEMVDNDQHQLIRLMTPLKNTVISIGERTRVLENLGGLKGTTNSSTTTGSTSNGQPASQGNSTDGPPPENLQLFTEGNTLVKSGGYMRVEVGPNAKTLTSDTDSMAFGDMRQSVTNDSTISIGGRHHTRIDLSSLTEIGTAVPPTAALENGTYRVSAQKDISFETPTMFKVNCDRQSVKTKTQWLDIGESTSMTSGVRTDIFGGQAVTVNLGALERLFVGTRISIFAALKADMNLAKSELNGFEEKVTIYEKKGIVTAMGAALTRIKTAVASIGTKTTSVESSVASIENNVSDIENPVIKIVS